MKHTYFGFGVLAFLVKLEWSTLSGVCVCALNMFDEEIGVGIIIIKVKSTVSILRHLENCFHP